MNSFDVRPFKIKLLEPLLKYKFPQVTNGRRWFTTNRLPTALWKRLISKNNYWNVIWICRWYAAYLILLSYQILLILIEWFSTKKYEISQSLPNKCFTVYGINFLSKNFHPKSAKIVHPQNFWEFCNPRDHISLWK